MTQEIMTNLYTVEIPLPNNVLRSVNSYIIKGPERNLIIDPGMNQEECLNLMQVSLKEPGVELRKTDFFVTHSHINHIGLVSHLAPDKSIIYINKTEMDIIARIRFGPLWDDIIDFMYRNGFPENELREILHPNHYYRFNKRHLPFKPLEDGDRIIIGEYLFECLRTPGHSKGHMCLYDPKKKIFVAGDHIPSDITPGIQLGSDKENPLKEYLVSLDKVYQLDIKLVLPGHRAIFRNCKGRIKELQYHYQKRVDEIISILEEGERNAYQLTSEMTWDITYDSWDLFPVMQKWFATGEAIAHLKYLEEKGVIRKEMRQQKIIFSLN